MCESIAKLAKARKSKIAMAHDADWDEGKHKRASNGQFGSGGGGNASAKKASATKSESQLRGAAEGTLRSWVRKDPSLRPHVQKELARREEARARSSKELKKMPSVVRSKEAQAATGKPEMEWYPPKKAPNK